MSNDFPWTPQHGQPAEEATESEIVKATEEVVPDSGDQAVPDEAVVDKPVAKKPAATKAAKKTRVTSTKKDKR